MRGPASFGESPWFPRKAEKEGVLLPFLLTWSLTVILFVLALGVLGGALALLARAFFRWRRHREGYVALIAVEGVIGQSGPFGQGGVTADGLLDAFRRVGKDPLAKALILRLNTPGGSVGATQEIAMEVKRLKDRGIPVIASVSDMALSGGFWLLSQTSRSIAPPGAELGSIGVIISKAELSGLLDRLGVKRETVRSAEHKDFMSFHRPWDEEERAFLQKLNGEVFEQFLDAVATGRSMDKEAVRKVADGRIFTAVEAKEAGFLDEIGNLTDALDRAREMALLPAEAPLRRVRMGGLMDRLTGSSVRGFLGI